MSVGKMDYFSRLQTLLFFLMLNGTPKMKLAILELLCCERDREKLIKLAMLTLSVCCGELLNCN